jgi:hypothetical protein
MKMSIENDFETLPAEGLALVSTLAAEIRAKVARIEELNQEVKKESDALLQLETRRLPDAMGDLGFTEVRLEDGSVINVGPEYHVGIPKSKREDAHAWLREHGFGDLIKSNVWVEFAKGEEEQAQDLFTKLQAQYGHNRPLGLDSGVHAGTLKALVKEQHEGGNPLPEDLFGVFILQRATIKSPKLNTKSTRK